METRLIVAGKLTDLESEITQAETMFDINLTGGAKEVQLLHDSLHNLFECFDHILGQFWDLAYCLHIGFISTKKYNKKIKEYINNLQAPPEVRRKLKTQANIFKNDREDKNTSWRELKRRGLEYAQHV